jgi:hypothetical protein
MATQRNGFGGGFVHMEAVLEHVKHELVWDDVAVPQPDCEWSLVQESSFLR